MRILVDLERDGFGRRRALPAHPPASGRLGGRGGPARPDRCASCSRGDGQGEQGPEALRRGVRGEGALEAILPGGRWLGWSRGIGSARRRPRRGRVRRSARRLSARRMRRSRDRPSASETGQPGTLGRRACFGSTAGRRETTEADCGRPSVAARCHLVSIGRSSFHGRPTLGEPRDAGAHGRDRSGLCRSALGRDRQTARHPRRESLGAGRRRARHLMRDMGSAPTFRRPRTGGACASSCL